MDRKNSSNQIISHIMCIISYVHQHTYTPVGFQTKTLLKAPSIKVYSFQIFQIILWHDINKWFDYYNNTNHCKQSDQNLLTRSKIRLRFYLTFFFQTQARFLWLCLPFKSDFKHHSPIKSFPSCAQMELYPKQE